MADGQEIAPKSAPRKKTVTKQPLAPPQETNLPARRTPMDLLSAALEAGAHIDALHGLMDLHERWSAREARASFFAAVAAFRAEAPPIVKNRLVDYVNKAGLRVRYRFDDLAEIVNAITPVLASHGLSFWWKLARSESEKESIRVKFVLAHVDGHSEETSLEGPIDTSGSKNLLQSVGSTITYLQRYTLRAGLGFAAGNDDDGAGGAVKQEQPQQKAAPTSRSASTARNEPPDLPSSAAENVKLAEEFGSRIARASSMDDLNKIADDIQASSLPAASRPALKKLWGDRRTALTAPARPRAQKRTTEVPDMPQEPVLNPDTVLEELTNVISGAESVEDVRRVYADQYADHPALSFPGDKRRAQEIVEKRISEIAL